VLEQVPSLEGLATPWRELAWRGRNVFATYEWASTWWRHFGTAADPTLLACRSEDGRLVGIVPLYAWRRRPVRVLRLLGHGAGDELGPVCSLEDRALAPAMLREALDRVPHDVFVGDLLPGDLPWASALPVRFGQTAGSPLLRVGDRSWDDLLAGWSSNLRQQVRRRERNLAKRYDVSLRLADDPARLPDDLGTLFSLHAARREGRGSAFLEGRAAFHREFATLALERGWLRLWLLALDGEPAAAWYGLRFAGVESYYQAGWSEKFAEDSVAFVLLCHSMRSAVEDGMHEYRFLQGDEPFKYRFADEDPGLATIVTSRGAVGRAAAAAASVARGYGARRRSRGQRRASDVVGVARDERPGQ
jgi:CelD/BcsL family acetyltransferase involved in cellulose biosynthesis